MDAWWEAGSCPLSQQSFLWLFVFAPKIKSGGESGEQAAGVRLEFVASTLNSTNLTQIAYGIAGNVAAVLLYGSNFVPVKRIETGDGKYSVWFIF